MFGLILVFLLASGVGAVEGSEFAGRTEMSGIALHDYSEFPEKWPLVTVRFRQDTKEMRFVYANPIASAALKRGDADFPDGAVLAKVGHAVENDPAFTSSLVPSGTKRFQFMVRDRAKFAQTGGWGYALFDGAGKTFNEDPKLAVQACAACHNIVKSRGFVFSQFADFGIKPHAGAQKNDFGQFKFEPVPLVKIPAQLRQWLPANETEALQLVGDLRKNVFPGTLDEITPALTRESLRTGKSVYFLSDDGMRSNLVIWDRLNKSCIESATVSLMSIRSAPEIEKGLVKKSFCASR